MPGELGGSLCRARKQHRILSIQMVQQVARVSGDKLNSAWRQCAGFHKNPHCCLRHLGSGHCRFHDCRHARKQGLCQFFQHPPDREIVGIDVHRDPVAGRKNVLGYECAPLAEYLGLAIQKQFRVRKLSPPL